MVRWFALFLLCLLTEVPAFANASGITVQCWVKTSSQGQDFPFLLTNKNWEEGEIEDYTTHHNLGRSRSTGKLPGWCLALQPNGSWTWNIGDGENRLDYLPTFERQPVNDGRWHLLAFTVDYGRRAAHLYFDGHRVAVYSLDELTRLIPPPEMISGVRQAREGIRLREVKYMENVLSPEEIISIWENRMGEKVAKRPEGKKETLTFNVISWNIWHGGRRDGDTVGIQRTVRALRESAADIICMQETYGSGPAIADSLEFLYYYRSTNLSIMSRFPIVETHGWYQPFRFGGVTLKLPGAHLIKVFSLWIHYLPDLNKMIREETWVPEAIVAEENKTRGKEIREILQEVKPALEEKDSIPIIIAGDFNSPSHLDWTEDTREMHEGLVVPWPVSAAMAEAGFADAYRSVHPDPAQMPGRTWSPRFTESWQGRIDYIYFSGNSLRCMRARMVDQVVPRWPSDHAAVIASFQWMD